MNDPFLAINDSKIYLYADDVKLHLLISSHGDIIHLQSDMESLSSWCKLRSLKLNLKNLLF